MHWPPQQYQKACKMTNVCDDRIISMVKTNNFTTSKEDKNTLREIGVSLSVSTMEASA